MPGSDEKARLVPVVSTILKLSPAEIETIQKTINGKFQSFRDFLKNKMHNLE